MRVIKHTFYHVVVHLALFAGAALLIPIVTEAVEGYGSPWVISPVTFFGGIMLVLISAFLLYRIKESIPGLLQSLGAMIFLPGALNLFLSVFDLDDFFSANSGLTGMTYVQPATEFYIHHSVPAVLSVAAVYMAIGGILYWSGLKIQQAKDKMPWNQ